MTTQDDLIKQVTKKLQAGRKPTVAGSLLYLLIMMLVKAWALMALLGIAASALAVPGLALGYWGSLGVWWLYVILRPVRVQS